MSLHEQILQAAWQLADATRAGRASGPWFTIDELVAEVRRLSERTVVAATRASRHPCAEETETVKILGAAATL